MISMRGRPIAIVFSVTLLGVIGGIGMHARVQSPATGEPITDERGLSTDQIARAVNGRLRGDTDDNRRAVTLYISSLMKAKAPEEKMPPKS